MEFLGGLKIEKVRRVIRPQPNTEGEKAWYLPEAERLMADAAGG